MRTTLKSKVTPSNQLAIDVYEPDDRVGLHIDGWGTVINVSLSELRAAIAESVAHVERPTKAGQWVRGEDGVTGITTSDVMNGMIRVMFPDGESPVRKWVHSLEVI